MKGYTILAISVVFMVACHRQRKANRGMLFKYNEHANVSSLDPAFAKTQNNIWVCNQLYNGLTQIDDSLNVTADLAKHWSISKDGKTYSFTLRSDAFFHKHPIFEKDCTRAVVSSDVVYSLGRLSDESLASPGRWVMENVDSVEAINDTLLKIVLKKPFPGFLGLLATKYCSVVPEELVAHLGSKFGLSPIGTGPFLFKLWKENVKLVLRRNRNYHEFDEQGTRLPYIEAISVSFLPNKHAEFLKFLNGELDFLNSIDASYKNDLINTDGSLKATHKKAVKMLVSPYLNTEYLGILVDRKTPELQSKLFRKALNYAFDRQKIVTYLRNGIGTPATSGMVPQGMPGSAKKPFYTYDVAKAKMLLEAFMKTSEKKPEITLSTTSNYLDICEYLQEAFENIGIKTHINLLIASTMKQGKATGRLDIFRSSWIADYPDAESYLSLFYSKNKAPEGPNYTHYKNPLFDSLYLQAIEEIDLEKRMALYRTLDSIVMDDAPIIPLYYDKVVRFTSHKVKGLTNNPINLLNLKRVKVEN